MPTMQTVGVLITCAIAIGGILIFIGRALQSLTIINENQKVLFDKTTKHESEITDIKLDLKEVKTRQIDCGNCP